MSKPLIHAQNSAKKFGGEWQDYMDIHEFLDSSKSVIGNSKHRALTHNSWFISVVIPRVFGETFSRKSDGKTVSSRDIAEEHVSEDYHGYIPSAQDFLDNMECKEWMNNGMGDPPPSVGKIKRKTVKVAEPDPEVETVPFDGVKPTDWEELFKKYPMFPQLNIPIKWEDGDPTLPITTD
jgi:hypothetical protein